MTDVSDCVITMFIDNFKKYRHPFIIAALEINRRTNTDLG